MFHSQRMENKYFLFYNNYNYISIFLNIKNILPESTVLSKGKHKHTGSNMNTHTNHC